MRFSLNASLIAPTGDGAVRRRGDLHPIKAARYKHNIVGKPDTESHARSVRPDARERAPRCGRQLENQFRAGLRWECIPASVTTNRAARFLVRVVSMVRSPAPRAQRERTTARPAASNPTPTPTRRDPPRLASTRAPHARHTNADRRREDPREPQPQPRHAR